MDLVLLTSRVMLTTNIDGRLDAIIHEQSFLSKPRRGGARKTIAHDVTVLLCATSVALSVSVVALVRDFITTERHRELHREGPN